MKIQESESSQGLKDAVQLLSNILDSSPASIFALEAIRNSENAIVDFRFKLVNQAAEKFFQRTEEYLLTKSVLEEFPQAREKGLFNTYIKVVETDATINLERLYDLDVVQGWYHVSVAKWGDGIVATYSNINDLKEGQKQIEQYKNFLEESQAATHVGSFENDLLNDRLTCSMEYLRIYGYYGRKEIKFQDILDRIHHEDLENMKQIWTDAMQNHRPYNFRYRIVMPDATIKHIWGRGRFVYNPEGKAIKIIGTATDITRLHTIENELLQSKTELEKLNRNLEKRIEQRTGELKASNEELKRSIEELDRFAYIVSHDLKAPLTSIEPLLIMIKDEYKGKVLDEEGISLLDMALAKVEVMYELIQGVLDSAKKERKVKQPISIEEIVKAVISTIEPPENIHFFVQHNLPVVHYHKTSMMQVLQNLISNAIKYNDKKEGIIKISCKETLKHYQLCIADNGQGIKEEYLLKIFDMFQLGADTKSSESTGIGLSIVKKIIEENGGTVTAESEVDKGSTFCFTVLK